jgi:hypothetical protein
MGLSSERSMAIIAHETKPMPEPKQKRIRRNPEQLVADLQVRIEAIKARAARNQAKRNPAVRHTVAAVRSIDKAMVVAQDMTLRQSLEEARGVLTAWLALSGIAMPVGPAASARRVRGGASEPAQEEASTDAPRRRNRPRRQMAV